MKPLLLAILLFLSLAGFGQEVLSGFGQEVLYYPTARIIDTAILNKVDSPSLEKRKYLLWRDSLFAIRDSIAPKYDTLAIVMLVSDTTAKDQVYWTSLGNGLIQKETVSVVPNEIWQMVGYEVKKLIKLNQVVWIDDCTFKISDWVHVSYLDQAKKPLNLCVWKTKRRYK